MVIKLDSHTEIQPYNVCARKLELMGDMVLQLRTDDSKYLYTTWNHQI